MANVSMSVVHMKMRFNSTVLSTGTGMLYLHNEKYYIVTAWHNLSGRHSETLAIQNPQKAPPNNVVITITQEMPGYGGARIPFIVNLCSEEETFYYIHPINYPRIDVAVIPLDIEKPYEMQLTVGDGTERKGYILLTQKHPVPSELCPLQKYETTNIQALQACMNDIDVTDELFIPGYPENISDFYGNPVWKRATVASDVRQGWNREPKFLIDSASRPGMSGAPVFYYSKTGELKTRQGKIMIGREFAVFFGIYVGRMPSSDKDDAQIGVVWKREVVDEIIEGGRCDWHSGSLEATPREIRDAVLATLELYTESGVALILNQKADYRYYATNCAHKILEARASFEEVLTCIMDEASIYTGPYKQEREGDSA